MPRAEPVQVLPRQGYVRIRCEGLVLRLPPYALRRKRHGVAQTVVVAHLARRFIHPASARGLAQHREGAVAGGAQLRVHRSTFTLRDCARMAQVAGIQIARFAVLVERCVRAQKDLLPMQRVHVNGGGLDAGDSQRSQRVVAVARRAKHRRSTYRGLIER